MSSSHTRNIDDYSSQESYVSFAESQVSHDNDDVIRQPNFDSQRENNRYNEILYEAIKALSARQAKDLPQFTGSIREWPIFHSEFVRTTEEFHVSKDENLRRLNLALTGKAREAVLPLLTSPENVDTIIHVLKRNFGESEWVISLLIEDLKNLPRISDEEFDAFRNFYNKVTGTVKSIEQLNGVHYLDNPDILSCLSHKLPLYSRSVWSHYKASLTREGVFVNLQHFSSWLEEELDAQLAIFNPKHQNQPVYEHENVNYHDYLSIEDDACRLCKNHPRHGMWKCDVFKSMTTKTRQKEAIQQQLCFCCLMPGHTQTKCRSRYLCRFCKGRHHTLLHEEKHGSEISSNDKSTNKYSNVLSRVGRVHVKGPKGVVETFAIFDDGSTATQIEISLANELGLDGPIVPVTYKWTRDIIKRDDDAKVVQTQIAPSHAPNKLFELKNVRTAKHLSLNAIKFDIEKVLSLYPNIDIKMLHAIKDAKPRLLIGSNNAGLITPRESISYAMNGLQLTRCHLGWTIHGEIDATTTNTKEQNLYTNTSVENETSNKSKAKNDTSEHVISKVDEEDSSKFDPEQEYANLNWKLLLKKAFFVSFLIFIFCQLIVCMKTENQQSNLSEHEQEVRRYCETENGTSFNQFLFKTIAVCSAFLSMMTANLFGPGEC